MSNSEIDSNWSALVTLLPADLEDLAVEAGALLRRREVKSASDLLRLAMAYSITGMSLRQTSAWARESGVADLSDVAILKRLRSCSDWLGIVLGRMLAERASMLSSQQPRLRVRLIDATGVSRPGSLGTDWRIHMGFDLRTLVIDEVELTDARGGETLLRHPIREGEVLIGDAGYGGRAGVAHVSLSGGSVLVRVNARSIPLMDTNGVRLDLVAALRDLPVGAVADIPVWTVPDAKSGLPSVAGRLVAVRKSPRATEKARRKATYEASRKRLTVQANTLETAGLVMLFTTLTTEQVSGASVMDLYRLRWQIELAFKKLKGILKLDKMAARDDALCRTFLITKIIGALLVEQLATAEIAFSPWGYGTPRTDVDLAGPHRSL